MIMPKSIEYINTEHGKAYVTSRVGTYLKLRYKNGDHGWAECSKVTVLTGKE
jgi:hypothetical protein